MIVIKDDITEADAVADADVPADGRNWLAAARRGSQSGGAGKGHSPRGGRGAVGAAGSSEPADRRGNFGPLVGPVASSRPGGADQASKKPEGRERPLEERSTAAGSTRWGGSWTSAPSSASSGRLSSVLRPESCAGQTGHQELRARYAEQQERQRAEAPTRPRIFDEDVYDAEMTAASMGVGQGKSSNVTRAALLSTDMMV